MASDQAKPKWSFDKEWTRHGGDAAFNRLKDVKDVLEAAGTPTTALQALLKATYTPPASAPPEAKAAFKKDLPRALISAWQMYVLARWDSRALVEGGKSYNVIGRLNKPPVIEAPKGTRGFPNVHLRIEIDPGIYWSLQIGQHTVSFIDFTLQSDFWKIFVNDAWLLGGIEGGKHFLLLSPLSLMNLYDEDSRRMTVTAREAIGLVKLGYSFARTEARHLIHGTPGKSKNKPSAPTYQHLMQGYPVDKHSKATEVINLINFFQELPRDLTVHDSQHLLIDDNGKLQFLSSLDPAARARARAALVAMTSKSGGLLSEEERKLMKLLDSDVAHKDFEQALQKLWNDDPDLSLQGANLTQADLAGFDAGGKILDLRQAFLKGADLRGANLTKADLRWAFMSGVKTDRGTSFDRANVTGARMDASLKSSLPATCIDQEHNVLVRDVLGDNGSFPSTRAALSQSPDVVISQIELGATAKAFLADDDWNADYGGQIVTHDINYVYLRVRNIGTQDVTPTAFLYQGNFTTSLWNSTFWQKVGQQTLGEGEAGVLHSTSGDGRPGETGDRRVFGPWQWTPPSAQHYCLMCYVSIDPEETRKLAAAESFPLEVFGSQASYQKFVAGKAQACWRNTAVADARRGDHYFSMLGLSDAEASTYQLRAKVISARSRGARSGDTLGVDSRPATPNADGEVVLFDGVEIPEGQEMPVHVQYRHSEALVALGERPRHLDLPPDARRLSFLQYLDSTLIGAVHYDLAR